MCCTVIITQSDLRLLLIALHNAAVPSSCYEQFIHWKTHMLDEGGDHVMTLGQKILGLGNFHV